MRRLDSRQSSNTFKVYLQVVTLRGKVGKNEYNGKVECFIETTKSLQVESREGFVKEIYSAVVDPSPTHSLSSRQYDEGNFKRSTGNYSEVR